MRTKTRPIIILLALLLYGQIGSIAFSAQKVMIGKWRDPVGDIVVEIYNRDGNFYVNRYFPNGETLEQELSKGTGNTFHKKDSRTGDHYIINKNKELEMRDKLGLIDILQPMK